MIIINLMFLIWHVQQSMRQMNCLHEDRLRHNLHYQQVQKDLGHRSVQVTEKYQRCDEKKLKDDFPSLAKLIESMQNGQINVQSTRFQSTMNPANGFLHSREIN